MATWPANSASRESPSAASFCCSSNVPSLLALTRIEWQPSRLAASTQGKWFSMARPLGQLAEVVGVLGLVFEERVDVLDRLDAELPLRRLGEIEVVELAGAKRAVEGPLRQRDLEQRRLGRRGVGGRDGVGRAAGERCGGRRGGQERAAGE
ncbi:MAG: hypothetical protein LW698_07505 [Planctomycetaceae bacterium]|nr:hypothetical protein [Planctomycetaceae bacterium]